MIRNNPEFVKNVKLEFNPTRFVIPVLLLLLIVWIGWSGNPRENVWNNQYTPEQMKAQSLFGWLSGFGFLFTVVWGTYLTSNSLLEEMKLKSWDFVRMSSLSPFKILVGKMFGATSVVWVISLLGVLPCLLYAGAVMIPGDGIVRPAAETLAVLALCLLFWAVLSYALTLLLGLMADGKLNRGGAFSSTAVIFIMGTSIGGMITAMFTAFHTLGRYGPLPMTTLKMTKPLPLPPDSFVVQTDVSFIKNPGMSDWYGLHLHDFDLLLMVLAFFSAWAFVGAWRALRKSLQYHDAPWAWLGFIVTASLFLNGFRCGDFNNMRHFQEILCWPILVGIGTMFFACITEAGDIIRYRSFARKFAAGTYYEAFRAMPLWIISFAAFAGSMLLSVLLVGRTARALLFFVSLMGFAVRDLLAFHAISWSPQVRRPLVGLVVYMAVFYVLVPILANTAGHQAGYMFFPLVEENSSGAYWFFLAAEIVAAGYLFMTRWGAAFGEKSGPAHAR